MPTSATAAVGAVLTAIEDVANGAVVVADRPALLHALSATLRSLTAHADRFGLPDEPNECAPTVERPTGSTVTVGGEAPEVVPVPAERVALLAELEDGAVIIATNSPGARNGFVIWEKFNECWWTPGSDVSLTSDDVAAYGPFDIVRGDIIVPATN